jgi:hypothetical protein
MTSEFRDDHTILAFRDAVDRLRQPSGTKPGGMDTRPMSVHEAITRQMVETLTDDLHEIKSRINNLIFMVLGAIVIDVVLRMISP